MHTCKAALLLFAAQRLIRSGTERIRERIITSWEEKQMPVLKKSDRADCLHLCKRPCSRRSGTGKIGTALLFVGFAGRALALSERGWYNKMLTYSKGVLLL